MVLVAAAVAPIPVAFRYIVVIMTVVVIHQGLVVAFIKLGIQTLAITAVLIPARAVIMTTVSPIPLAIWYIVDIMAVLVVHQVRLGAKVCIKLCYNYCRVVHGRVARRESQDSFRALS